MKKVFYNGRIITLEGNESVESVFIENGKINEIGNYEDIIKKYSEVEKINLEGKTLIPAFLDPHSHFSGAASALLQVPLEEAVSIDEVLEKLSDFVKSDNLQENKWVIGKGYDHNNFVEKAHPTCEDLDKVSTKVPIVIQHKSGHAGVFNSKALELLGVTVDTVSPEGGLIGKKDNKLTGYMEETAFMKYMKEAAMPDANELFNAYIKVQEKYLSHGIATVQEGMMVSQMIPLYEALINNNMLKVDLVGYSEVSSAEKLFSKFKDSIMKYNKNFKLGGYKIFLDGSPQARTAWMLTPYLGEDTYYGYGTMKYEDVYNAIKEATKNNVQILAHCNGDAAAQQFIDAIKKVQEDGYDVKSLRPVMIHSQLLRIEQLEDVKKLGIIPSFFVAHVYHWGDVHINNFGFERASKISPTASALENGITFTFHQDSPVIEPNMMETIHCAVNRKTKSGVLLGENERISVIEALKAVTINAAYQYFEEDKKGSIKVGKNADFVILDKNPLEVPIEHLKDIKILETIKDGVTIYKRNK